MVEHCQEFACAKCGDLFYAQWKRLCTICDHEVSAARQAALNKLIQSDSSTAERIERELEDAVRQESLPTYMRPKKSMWSGHKE